MSIKPVQGHGAHRASVICDGCEREEPVTCDYLRRTGKPAEPNIGQIKTKIQRQGWEIIKGKHRCPSCAARRRAAQASVQKEADMAKETVAELRRPSRDQKREIIEALQAAYDVKAGRYEGGYTDKVVAQEIGNGILHGWVTEQREELFGPAGGNQELESLDEAVRGLRGHYEEFGKQIAVIFGEHEAATKEIVRLARKLEAVKSAVGPKAGAR